MSDNQTYDEWFDSLKEGDIVRVRFPWDDYTFKGGAMCDGAVKQVNDRRADKRNSSKTVLVEYDRHNNNELRSQIFFVGGNGGPFMHLEHPTITSVHTIDGYKFPHEIS